MPSYSCGLPDRARGAASTLCVQEETSWGCVATGQQPRGIEFVSEDLANNFTEIQSQRILPGRGAPAPQVGNARPGGSINLELSPVLTGMLLKHVFGPAAIVTTGSSPKTHVFSTGENLPDGLTIEKRFNFRSGAKRILRYLGCRINEFAFQVPNDGIVTARIGLIARYEDDTQTSPLSENPTYPTNDQAFVSSGSTLTVRDSSGVVVSAPIKSGDGLISNNIGADEFVLDGTQARFDAPEDLRSITGNMVACFTNESYALYQAVKANSTSSVVWQFVRGAYSLKLEFPTVKLRGPAPTIGGRGPIDIPLTYSAFYDATVGYQARATIVTPDAQLNTAA